MKLIQKLTIDNKIKQLINTNIILELNACGRGFIVINASKEETFLNKIVRIEIGYHDNISRFFTGYVESEQNAENGTKKLMIKEMIGVYSRIVECSFLHPTLKNITDFLVNKLGLDFDLPKASYINKKIPHFKHLGTGFHLLQAIGKAFNIPDFIFYQKSTPTIFLGSYSDCFYCNKPIDIGDNLNKATLKTASANTVILPFIPNIRPGTTLNGRRIKLINLINNELTITFEHEELNTFRKQLQKNNPEITANYHLPMLAKVIAISDECRDGNISTPFRPRYAVDVKILNENGEESQLPILKSVPLPVALGGVEKGAFCYPDIGSIVDIAFAYGRADQPIIRNVYPINTLLPEVKAGEILVQQRQEVYQRIDEVGNTTRETDQKLHDISREHYTQADHKENNYTQRQTTITADDTTQVLGHHQLNAGSSVEVVIGDKGLAVGGNCYQSVNGDFKIETKARQNLDANSYVENIKQSKKTTANEIQTIAQQISEQAQATYSIIAGASAQLIAPSVWIGSNQINISQCMLDTLSLIKQLADLTAQHTHALTNTGTSPPINASAIQGVGSNADTLDSKYSSVISQ